MAASSPVFAQLAQQGRSGPVVVAHRGDSANFPENTLPAFAAALRLGVAMQEFDTRQTRDGVLVCMHDATLDRTTDAAMRLGPGALVAEVAWEQVRDLDAGTWHGPAHRGTRVPSLAEVLAALAPACIAMVERKAGAVTAYVAALRHADAVSRCILQSFDWAFVAAAQQQVPDLATAVLGPTPQYPRLDAGAIEAARGIGAGMLHWAAADVGPHAVAACHDAGLLLCTYTTDDELGMCGGATLGIDAMCTNHPARMQALQHWFRSRRPPSDSGRATVSTP
jgi:glycerophosphoryl diester phosphodiesterase